MVMFSPVGGDDSANEFHLQELHANTSVQLLCCRTQLIPYWTEKTFEGKRFGFKIFGKQKNKKSRNHWSISYLTATLNGLVFPLSVFRPRCLAMPRFLSRHRVWASPVRSSFPDWDNNRRLSGPWSQRTFHARLLWRPFIIVAQRPVGLSAALWCRRDWTIENLEIWGFECRFMELRTVCCQSKRPFRGLVGLLWSTRWDCRDVRRSWRGNDRY